MVGVKGNFEILVDGTIVRKDGRILKGKTRYIAIGDNGRPEGNAAGLKPTEGIKDRPGAGRVNLMDVKRIPRYTGRFGQNNTILSSGQKETEEVTTEDSYDGKRDGEIFEEIMSRDAREDTLKQQLNETHDNRRGTVLDDN